MTNTNTNTNTEFDTSLFYDVRDVFKLGYTFNWLIGGRGIGKTYSALGLMYELTSVSDRRFIYLRCSETECEACAADEMGNPFKKLNTDKGWDIRVDYHGKTNSGKVYEENGGKTIGYVFALSTFANLRGIDLSDVDVIVFDEFIREKHKNNVRGMGQALMNLYETVNRNRELFGQPPVRLICMSNAIKLDSEILHYTNLISEIEVMAAEKTKVRTCEQRDTYIELIFNEDFATAKSDTALYKFMANTKFHEQNIMNVFNNDSFEGVSKLPIKSFRPYCRVENIFIYKHKTQNILYACSVRTKTPNDFLGEGGLRMFRRQIAPYISDYLNTGKLRYESYTVKLDLFEYMGLR